MGKIVTPKTEGRVNVIKKALEVYDVRKPKWVSNADYIVEMRKDPQMVKKATSNRSKREDLSWYTAVVQIPSYFGLIEHESNNDKNRRLTSIGEAYLKALKLRSKPEQKRIIFDQLEGIVFGRNNSGAPSSDSDYEVPRIAVRAIYDLEPISKRDLIKTLYYVVEKNLGYDAVKLQMLKEKAGSSKWVFGKKQRDENKYLSDPKFLEFLIDNGIVKNIGKTKRSIKYVIPKDIRKSYCARIESFQLTNKPLMISVQDSDSIEVIEEESFNSSNILSPAELAARESNPPIPCAGGKSKRYKTDPDILKTALSNHKYECCYGGKSHFSFYRKDGTTPYVEGHHVIPMKAQKDYPEDSVHRVDREANIVALCPLCHKMVHHGAESDVKKILTKIYDRRRRTKLAVFGIKTVDDLYNKYYS